MEIEQPKTIYFANLNILRALAVFMVVFKHGFEAWVNWVGYPLFLRGKDIKDYNLIGDYFRRFFGNLHIGVDLFFIISGFLITYLLLYEKQNLNRIDIKRF